MCVWSPQAPRGARSVLATEAIESHQAQGVKTPALRRASRGAESQHLGLASCAAKFSVTSDAVPPNRCPFSPAAPLTSQPKCSFRPHVPARGPETPSPSQHGFALGAPETEAHPLGTAGPCRHQLGWVAARAPPLPSTRPCRSVRRC